MHWMMKIFRGKREVQISRNMLFLINLLPAGALIEV
ncbi:hypothetical protein NEOC95_001442 [Neochlamydia sp. AcF95]|nr:hypothetical protein [Neochlamydia sp. AcF95]